MFNKSTFEPHKIVKNSTSNNKVTVCPFLEKPAITRDEKDGKMGMNAIELFSMFTADIIRERVVFVR